jgi:aspartate/methionine/tyrosine aminotransferase
LTFPQQMRVAARRGMSSMSGVASRRGREAPALLPTYLSDARGVQTYDASERPDGVLQLSVAENQMISDLLVPKIRSIAASPASPAHGGGAGLFEQGDIFYQQTHGTARCRAAVATHMERVLCRGSYAIDPDKLIIGAGCNAVLENLLFSIADAGEGVLVPRPYYAAFEFDLKARADLTVLPVGLCQGSGLEAASYYPTPEALEASYSAALARGITPRALLLSSPNNPLGVCYPAETLRDVWAWSESKPNLHLISDEIYAGSVYREGGAAGQPIFVSLATVAARQNRSLGPNAHLVWALSKDFALSGLRVGAVYTENEAIRTPMQKLNDLCQVNDASLARSLACLPCPVCMASVSGWRVGAVYTEKNAIRTPMQKLNDLCQVGSPAYGCLRTMAPSHKPVPGETKSQFPRFTGVRGSRARCNCNWEECDRCPVFFYRLAPSHSIPRKEGCAMRACPSVSPPSPVVPPESVTLFFSGDSPDLPVNFERILTESVNKLTGS